MSIITIGIDLANNVFAPHGVNEAGKPELVKPKVPRDQSWRSGSQPDVAVLAQHSDAIGDIPRGMSGSAVVRRWPP